MPPGGDLQWHIVEGEDESEFDARRDGIAGEMSSSHVRQYPVSRDSVLEDGEFVLQIYRAIVSQ